MMTSLSELSIGCKQLISHGEQGTEETRKLREFVAHLEEEKLKIDAFKHELPLCMQLLTNAMETSLQELQSENTNREAMPVLEEFMPLKSSNSSELSENLPADKAKWMASAQLWYQEIDGTNLSQSPSVTSDHIVALNTQQRINGRGAFHPFSSKGRISSSPDAACPELALSSSYKGEIDDNNNSSERVSRRENSVTQTQRKARRCWSPELHRRFVNALHTLGGPQVATPKQIRQLMKVDGLTNDEVKSHLQKYRLHTRCPSSSPQTAVTGQLVVVGGIWLPSEYSAAQSLYGTHLSTTCKVSGSPAFFSTSPLFSKETYHAITPPQPPPVNPPRHHPNVAPDTNCWEAGTGGETGTRRPEIEVSNGVFVTQFLRS